MLYLGSRFNPGFLIPQAIFRSPFQNLSCVENQQGNEDSQDLIKSIVVTGLCVHISQDGPPRRTLHAHASAIPSTGINEND